MKFINLLFIPILAFGFDLEFTKKFHHELPEDTLTADIIITIEDETENEINQRIKTFTNRIKRFDKVEKKYRTLNIKPRYRHLNTTPKIIGYVGVLKYKLNTNKANLMDEVISELTDLKRFRDTKVSVYNLAWTVKEETYNVALDLLRFEAINWGTRYSRNLSIDTKSDCKINKVIVEKVEAYDDEKDVIYKNKPINSTKETSIPELEEEKRLSIDVKYKLECK